MIHMAASLFVKSFRVNDQYVVVVEGRRGRGNSSYTCSVFTPSECYAQGGYAAAPGEHKAVLLSFLDDAGKAGAIDGETANWSEGSIEEVRIAWLN